MNTEKVKHIADLAKLDIKEDEIEKYKIQLTDILTEIDKIMEVNIDNEKIMISSSTNRNCYSEDIPENHISTEDALKNC